MCVNHFVFSRGSEELRMEVSKRLTDECKRGRAVQVKQREIERKLALESENVEIQEARRLQLEEVCILHSILYAILCEIFHQCF